MTPQHAAALAALTQKITGLTNAVTLLSQQQAHQQQAKPQPAAVKPEKRPGSADDSDGGPLGKVLTLATAKVLAFLAPLVAVSAVLSQTASGFGVFTSAMKLFSATIAPLLLPIFVLLAAALVAVSDEIWDLVKNALPQWYRWVMDHGVPAMVALVAAVRKVIEWMEHWAVKLGLKEEPVDPMKGRRDNDEIVAGRIPAPVVGMSPDRIRNEWQVIREQVRLTEREVEQIEAKVARGEATQEDLIASRVARNNAKMEQTQYLKAFEGDPRKVMEDLNAGNVPRLRAAPAADGSPPASPAPPRGAPPAAAAPPPQQAEERRRLADDNYRPSGFYVWNANRQNEWFLDRDRRRMDVAGQPGEAAPAPSVAGPGGPVPAPLPGPGQPPAPGQPAPAQPAARRPTPGERFNVALRDVVQSVRMQVAPPAAMMATNNINREVQKAALQQDPIERRSRERTLTALDELLRLLPKIEENTRQRPNGLFDPNPNG